MSNKILNKWLPKIVDPDKMEILSEMIEQDSINTNRRKTRSRKAQVAFIFLIMLVIMFYLSK